MQKVRKVFGILRIILRVLLIAVVAVLAAYNIYMLIQRYAYGNKMPKVFGVATAVVATGSMQPEICVNDLVIIKEADIYQVDDVITFYDSSTDTYITHRIIFVDGDRFVTKGDANNAEDGSITKSAIVGKVVKVLRGAGNTISFFQSPAGLFTVIAVGVVIWGVADVVLILLDKKDKENEDEQEKV